MYRSVQKCTEVYRSVQKCTEVYRSVQQPACRSHKFCKLGPTLGSTINLGLRPEDTQSQTETETAAVSGASCSIKTAPSDGDRNIACWPKLGLAGL